jgi:hypothetical protein
VGGFVLIKNWPSQASCQQASLIVRPNALALARFGLRAADDARILNTLRAIDAPICPQDRAGIATMAATVSPKIAGGSMAPGLDAVAPARRRAGAIRTRRR